MKKLLFLFTVLISLNGHANIMNTKNNIEQQESNRIIVIDFYNKFFNEHKVDEASVVVVDEYKQHNPYVPDGKKPFTSYFKEFFKENPTSKAEIIRSAVDGDLVWLHVKSTKNDADKGEAVIDIFRVQNGKIVEHWDVIQTIPEGSANNNTMF